ncbi:TonB-dependent receptor [Novosphingobium sp.]|uniref:TonB-dependent receptor n=1 Tax=Novosphingobium sp. TaxID=1874826 RepID=UPI00286C95AA|nr:TonB-dependent receptor [Novosphingobium sp.]
MKRLIQYWPLPLALVASPALAQDPAAPPPLAPEASQVEQDADPAATQEDLSSAPRPGELVVVGDRLRGQLETPQQPIAVLNEGDIQALGVGSIGELVARVAPQTGSGRGRSDGQPVIMVNGQRITNFREMRNFPPEAIQRVEILPEETAQRYGYPPDSRVINLILKKKYRAFAVEEGSSFPTGGGYVGGSLEATLTRIDGPGRLSLTGTLSAQSPVFESERDLAPNPGNTPTVAGDPDPQRYRTLIGQSRNYGVNFAWVKGYGKDGMDGTLTLSAAANRADTRSLQGLNSALLTDPGGAVALRTLPGAIEQTANVTTVQAGAGYSRLLGSWQFNATLDVSRGETRTLTDRRADTSGLVAAAAAGTLPITAQLPALPGAGQDRATSTSNRVENLVTLIGRPVRLPGGDVTTTAKSGFTLIGFDSADQRSFSGPVSLNRFRVLGGLNLAIPLTSRREGFLAGIGDVTLNLSGDVSHLSDFGMVNGWSAGLTWAPLQKLNLQASYIVNQTAPSISQLGNPATSIANVPLYDFSRGETVLVGLTTGGNPLLRKEQQRDFKLGANWQLPVLSGSSLLVEYFRNRSGNVTASFPLLTPEIEAAFPGRVTRDGSGRLVAIDQRPVTFYRQESARLRWGVNLSAGFGKAEGMGGAAPAAGGPPRGPGPGAGGPRPGGAGGPPRAGGGRGGGGGGMGALFGGGAGGPPGRWSFGLYHTVQFENRVTISPGGPVLDLLGGDALSASGTPRHSLEFNGGLFYKGLGTFVQGSWSAPTTVKSSGAPGTSDIRFGSQSSINLFMFVDFSARPKWVREVPFLKGMRAGLRVENLFDSRQRVTDGSSQVPLSYQSDYLDPRGRVIGFSLRKLF